MYPPVGLGQIRVSHKHDLALAGGRLRVPRGTALWVPHHGAPARAPPERRAGRSRVAGSVGAGARLRTARGECHDAVLRWQRAMLDSTASRVDIHGSFSSVTVPCMSEREPQACMSMRACISSGHLLSAATAAAHAGLHNTSFNWDRPKEFDPGIVPTSDTSK
jgi:hypothetical protein